MPQSEYYLPSEWASQSGIQLTWPHEHTDWQPYLSDITDVFLHLARAIAQSETLIIATPEPENVKAKLKLALSTRELNNVEIYECPSNDTWARDHGAITLCNNKEEFRFLDFQFNGWGEKFCADKDNAITRNLFQQGAFNGKLIDCNDFVLEGGSIESDGKGTIMTTSSCLLAPHRNQPLSLKDIEKELLRRLGAERVLWINHGSLIGDDTDGHIDTIARFAPNDTIVYVGCDDKADSQYTDFMLLEEELQHFKTINGKPYNLLRLPMPRAILYDGERLPATYANFLIINGAVIVPTYNQPDLDEQAIATVSKAFPGHDIIGIDASVIIRQHGSIHCLTMQYPKGALRMSTHNN